MSNSIELFEEQARSTTSTSDLEEFLAFLSRPPRFAAYRTKLVYSRIPLTDLALEWQRNDPDLRIINESVNAYQIEDPEGDRDISSSTKRRSGYFALLPSSRPAIYRLTTLSYSTFWNRGVLRSVRRGYPHLMPIFFQQNEIKDALLDLERALSDRYRLVITDVGIKEPRVGQSPTSRVTRFDTERLWTRASLKDMFFQAEERSQSFTSVGLTVFRVETAKDRLLKVASVKVNKRGEFQTNYLYREVGEELLQRLEGPAAERIAMLSNRGLIERDLEPARPIQITYSSEVFTSPERLGEFSAIIAKYPNSTKAVFHSNPYYHVSVADFKDGSSMDVWILSPRRILLIPQAKSSAPAFGRLISYIFANFQEGTVSEYVGVD